MNRKKLLKTILQLIIYLLVGYFILSRLDDTDDLFEALSDGNPIFLSLALLLFAMHTLYNSFVWGVMIKLSGEQSGYIDQSYVYIRSYLLRYIPGNVVGILGRAYYNREYGVPLLKSLWGWVFENTIYLMIGCLIGSYLLTGRLIGSFEQGYLIIPAIAAAVVFLLYYGTFERLVDKYLLKRMKKLKDREFEGLGIDLRKRMRLTLLYVGSWLIYSLAFLSLAFAFADGGLNDFDQLVRLASANALAWSIGYLSIVTPSGSGVREGVLVFLLTKAVGLSGSLSVIISLSARVLSIAGELIVFLLVLVARFVAELRGHKFSSADSE